MARDSVQVPHLGIFTMDAHLVVRTWDAFLVRITGVAANDALGQPIGTVLPDLEERGVLDRIRDVALTGTVDVLSPALHGGLVVCPPSVPSEAGRMAQRITMGPVREDGRITGVAVTIEDVTRRADHGPLVAELTRRLDVDDWRQRQSATEELAAGQAALVGALVQTLREQHRNFSVLSSVLDLMTSADVDLFDPLVACLEDDDVDLRMQVALILGERRDRRAIPALLRALNDADANVRFHAIEALGALRASDAAEALVEIATGGDFFLAFPAVHALSAIGDLSVAPRLVPLLKDDLLRSAVSEALGELGDELVIAPLVQLLNEPGTAAEVFADALVGVWDRYEQRYRAGDHIAGSVRQLITPTGTQNLLDAANRVGSDRLRSIAQVMGWLSGTAIQRALTRLLGRDVVRSQVVEALVRYGAGVLDLLVEQLGAEDLDTRQAAVVAIGRIGDRAATPALVAALADPELALPVAGALARLGDPLAFDALLGLLGHGDAAVRQAAIAALNSIGHERMPEYMAQLLVDPDPLLRESAVRISGYFGYRECADLVLGCCSDAHETVRRAAIEQLPFFEHPGVIEHLGRALERDAPAVRAAAATALARVSTDEAIDPLLTALGDADAWVRYAVVRALAAFKHPEIANAVRILMDADPAPFVRLAGIDVLGRLDTPDAVDVLRPLLASGDHDIARAAIRALGHTSDPRAAELLADVARFGESSHRAEAVMAIGSRGGVDAASALEWVAAADSDARVADAAINGLGKLGAREDGEAASAAIGALIALTAEPTRREASVAVLAGLPKRRATEVAEGLRHSAPDVRRATVEALSRMRTPEASQFVEGALADTVPAVRSAAVAELRRLGSRGAAKKLLGLARTDPDVEVRHAAVMAITQRTPDLAQADRREPT